MFIYSLSIRQKFAFFFFYFLSTFYMYPQYYGMTKEHLIQDQDLQRSSYT